MSDHLDLVPRYKQRRRICMDVNSALVQRLGKDVMEEGGKKLGIFKSNTLVLDSEDEIAVLMDFCIHDVRRNGRTAVESLVLKSPYAPASGEMDYLNALLQARFSLFLLERIEPGCGVEARDLRWGGTKFIMDIGLGTTGRPQLVLAARIIPFESVYVSTGAPLLAGLLPNNWEKSPLQHLLKLTSEEVNRLSPQEISEWNATMIRTLLKAGAAEHTVYRTPGEISAPPQRPAPLRHTTPIGRNDPCSCGSGKKFKKCCGLRK